MIPAFFGNQEVIFFFANGDECQIVDFGSRQDSHPRICSARCHRCRDSGMRYFFPFVTSDFSTAKPGLLQEIIQKDACAAAFLAVHVAQSNQLLYAPYPERVIFCNHQALCPLHAPYKLHPTFWYVLSNVCQVVRAAGFI